MRRFLSATSLALAVSIAAPALPGASFQAVAQDDEEKKKSSQTLSSKTARGLETALNALNSDPAQPQVALTALNNLANGGGLAPFDLSTVLEIRGVTYVQLENYSAALRDFVRVIEIDALPDERIKQIRFNVAQLYFQEEKYSETIRFMRDYLNASDGVDDPNAWYILAAAYAQIDQYTNARRPAEQAKRFNAKKREALLRASQSGVLRA